MKKIIWTFNKVEEKFLAYTFIVMIVIVFTQVVLRSFGHANSWSEELARYIYIWECWVGLSFCQRYHGHIRITALSGLFSDAIQKALECVVIFLCGAVSLFLAYLGLQMVIYLLELNTNSPYMMIPYWIIYAAMPVGCVGYVFRLSLDAYTLITGKDVSA